jgi:hypothetical protein
MRRALLILTIAALAACGNPANSAGPSALPSSLSASRERVAHNAVIYTFATMDDPVVYSNYNALTGINNLGHITGYYGSGAPSDPSEGYIVYPPYQPQNYRPIQFPEAVDTYAMTLNNKKVVAGYYIERKGNSLGFSFSKGIWSSYQDPHARHGAATSIMGLNDLGTAVGNFQSPSDSAAFQLNIARNKYSTMNPPNATNVVATGINGNGDVVGYLTQVSGGVVGFIRKAGTYTTFSYPGSTSTKFFGVTAHDYIVGCYTDGYGNTHGFLLISPLWKPGTTWVPVDDPSAAGTTVVMSVNIHLVIVGYYVDSDDITHGFVGTPNSSS